MKCCICVKKPTNIFTNGCFQQSLYIWKMLNFIPGIECDMVTVESDYDTFDDLIDVKIKQLTRTSVTQYQIVFMLSLALNVVNEGDILKVIKQNGIKLIDILCGNLFILLQEEFVFNCHNIMKNYRNEYIDEVWVLEMYDYAREFLEMVYAKPVKVLPYVWDTDIIRTYLAMNKIVIPDKPNKDKINICVYEANMSLHKNAYNPLLIAETYYKRNPAKLNKVFVFCKEKMFNNGFYEKLEIVKNGKIEFHGRMIMPTTLDLLTKQTGYKNVVLSHTFLNNLNFIHLELFYMKVQIVHNCEPFSKNGLYYDTFNLYRAVELLEKARREEPSVNDTIDIICKFNCKNEEIQNKWSKEMNDLLLSNLRSKVSVKS